MNDAACGPGQPTDLSAGISTVMAHGAHPLVVSCVHGLAAFERFAADIDRLNLASARPTPFNSAAFLRCYALRIEYYRPGRDERLFLVRENGRLIGCAAMRSTVEALGAGPARLRGVRLQFLAPLDTERHGIICAREDEERVAAALIRHLCQHERAWGLVEFAGQRPNSAVHRAVHAAAGAAFRARDIRVAPYNEVTLAWKDLAAYFGSLAKKMRSNISRQARHLFAAGEPTLILADGPAAVSAWFDAYLDLDGRSWKDGTPSSLRRHPRRIRYFREIAAGAGGFDPGFIGILLEGELIAALLTGANDSASPANHGAWCLEMAYDRSRAPLGPGQLLLLLAVGEAIATGHRHLNFLQNYAEYKHRWAALPIEVVNVQLIRRLSVHNLSAIVGDAKRELRWRRAAVARTGGAGPEAATEPAPGPEPSAVFEPAAGDDRRHAPISAAEHAHARELAAAALAARVPGVRRLDRDACRRHLPFDID